MAYVVRMVYNRLVDHLGLNSQDYGFHTLVEEGHLESLQATLEHIVPVTLEN